MLMRMRSNSNSHSLTVGMPLPNNPITMPLGIYPKELKTCPQKNLHMMLIAALFISAKTCKQSRYPSVDEWIKCSTYK